MVSIILAAVYTLNMVQKVFYGESNAVTGAMQEISFNQKLVLSVLVILIFLFGVFPQPLIDLTKGITTAVLARYKVT
jgi:NADH-quinone oxidoreductase subunit M